MLEDGYEYYGSLFDELDEKAPKDVVAEAHEQIKEDDLPTIKHGRWIIRDIPRTEWYQITCSECGEDVTSSAPCIGFLPNAKVLWDYCPHCGAKMDEVADEWEEPEINPCRGCIDYDGQGGCRSNGGCGADMKEERRWLM